MSLPTGGPNTEGRLVPPLVSRESHARSALRLQPPAPPPSCSNVSLRGRRRYSLFAVSTSGESELQFVLKSASLLSHPSLFTPLSSPSPLLSIYPSLFTPLSSLLHHFSFLFSSPSPLFLSLLFPGPAPSLLSPPPHLSPPSTDVPINKILTKPWLLQQHTIKKKPNNLPPSLTPHPTAAVPPPLSS